MSLVHDQEPRGSQKSLGTPQVHHEQRMVHDYDRRFTRAAAGGDHETERILETDVRRARFHRLEEREPMILEEGVVAEFLAPAVAALKTPAENRELGERFGAALGPMQHGPPELSRAEIIVSSQKQPCLRGISETLQNGQIALDQLVLESLGVGGDHDSLVLARAVQQGGHQVGQ